MQGFYEKKIDPPGYDEPMDYDLIREALFEERKRRGWSREAAARRVTKAMKAKAAQVAAEDAHLPEEERRSLRPAITGQGLNNWEMKRSRPSFEDLESWAEALDYRIILEAVPVAAAPLDTELHARFGRLGPDEQKSVMLYVDLLARTDGPFQAVLTRYPNMMAETLPPVGSSDRSAT